MLRLSSLRVQGETALAIPKSKHASTTVSSQRQKGKRSPDLIAILIAILVKMIQLMSFVILVARR